MTQGRLKRILYVEDDKSIQMVAQIALETVGDFELKICSSGQEDLDQYAAFKPDLFLLDVTMPDMDGLDVLHALRERPDARDIPVMFMTASVQPAEIAEYHQAGAVGVIAKPFEPLSLAQEILTIWQQC